MSLYLKIDQDAATNFFSLYDPLGRQEKKIWDAARWWVKKFPCAHPKQIKIADHIGCSRKHVNRAFAKFKSYGWLHLTSRGARRTKILGIPNHLIALDLVNREYFKRIEVTSKVTHSSSRYLNITSRAAEVLKIPLNLEKYNLNREDSLKLAMLNEKTLQDVLKTAKEMGAQGWRPDNPSAYLAGMGISMANKRGEPLDWKRYYKSLRAA